MTTLGFVTGVPLMPTYEILPVVGKSDLNEFIRLPWSIYRDDPVWVPPLVIERRDFLDSKKNPFFQHAEVAFWLARREGRPVGRISAQINHAHLAQHGDGAGHFGMLEAENDGDLFSALLGTAENWLNERGMTKALGPFSLSINDESGLLVDGFDTPPNLMMGHARPYFGSHVEAAGYTKVKDLLCYEFLLDSEPPAHVAAFLGKAARMEGLTIRPLDMRRFREEIANIVEIFNDAWSDNWGFVPMSEAEIRHLADELKLIVRPEMVAFAELDDRAVAMAVSLPNLNEAIADLNGRLLPFGLAKLLWRIKVKSPKTGRMPLMGVRKAYQGTPLGAVLAFGVVDAVHGQARKRGVERGELSWVLEDNMPTRRLIEQLGGTVYKTYRVYGRALG